ncbi:MAG: type II toxin-antitoxin system RelE/ParE family toxin [Ignavibacteriae bacterium]|nr:type II toxin-antitoxin system RelE/ParE family toxin [Ignavibacteriota bacterium]MCB0750543.1 type II toxin-antitoxin system RelE/ParE family toxin [Ignavibacteriota bacterium]
MKNGYKIIWSNEAFENLKNILEYLEFQWTKKEINNFAKKLDRRINLISEFPFIFPISPIKKSVRRSVLTKQISLYYQINESSVEIITLIDNRSDPDKINKI